jgi:endonuclease/exonuclease/phosphatase family metal-dependent hydrolase
METDCGPSDTLRVLSWNIDGLDENSDMEDILGRTLWVIREINRTRPHVVFLQELVELSISIIEQQCKNSFHVFRQINCTQPYFVAILVHKSTMDIVGRPEPIPFPKSVMGREGLLVTARLRNVDHLSSPISFITAHFESTREFAVERKNQFETCWKFIQGKSSSPTNNNHSFTVFGGDLNARDSDVPKILSNLDCWVLAGKPTEHQYTWDLVRNKNSVFPDGAQPRCRFDRMYVVPGTQKSVPPIKDFQLVGTEPVPNRRHASDHFGVLVEISLKSNR